MCSSHAVFAWEAYEKGADVHLQADPTKLELLHRQYKVKKGDFEEDKKLSVMDKVHDCILHWTGGQVGPRKIIFSDLNLFSLCDGSTEARNIWTHQPRSCS